MIHSVIKSFFLAQVACERLVQKRGELIVRKEADFINEQSYSSAKSHDHAGPTVKSGSGLADGAEYLKCKMRNFLRPRLRGLLEATIGDSREVNELRAEIATLRSEIIELRSA